MTAIQPSPRLAGLPPYVPGKRPRQDESARNARLASNESPWPPLAAVEQAMAESLGESNRYPDASYYELRVALATMTSTVPENIAVSNGSASLLRDLVCALTEAGEEVVFATPSFPYYNLAVLSHGAVPVAVPLKNHRHDLDGMLEAVTDRTRMVIVCNPNNPTGTIVDDDSLLEFIGNVPDNVAVVLDEAYIEFSHRDQEANWLDSCDNVIVIRTLSKAHGLASLRLGYAIGPEYIMSMVSRIAVPFRITSTTVAGAMTAVQSEQIEQCQSRIAALLTERSRVTAALEELKIPHIKSIANFIFLPLGEESAAFVDICYSQHVLVREVGGGVRVTVGSREDNDQFLDAAKSAVQSSSINNSIRPLSER